MAFVDTTTFTGKDAQGFYSAALLTGDTKSIIKPYTGIKSKEKIARLDLDGILQEADCTYTDGGNTTLSQKTLEVCALKVNKTFCQRTFEANYLSAQLRAGSNSDGSIIPDSFEAYVLDLMSKNISAGLEDLLWNGDVDGSPASLCNGFIKLFDANADNDIVEPSGAANFTASNIIAQMTLAYAGIPASVLAAPDLTIFVSTATAALYKLAQATVATGNGSYFVGDKPLDFLGIKIVASKSFPANKIVIAQAANLWFGTDLMSDFEDVMILPMKSVTGAPEVRFIAEFKFGVQYGVGSEIVYFHQ